MDNYTCKAQALDRAQISNERFTKYWCHICIQIVHKERERERTYQVTYDAYLSKNANVNVKF